MGRPQALNPQPKTLNLKSKDLDRLLEVLLLLGSQGRVVDHHGRLRGGGFS